MKNLNFLCLFLGLLFQVMIVQGQDTVTAEVFKPHGAPIIKVFANVHSGLVDEERNAAFEIRRAYLGYEYNLTEHFYTQVKLDIGSPDDISEFSRIRRYAYFKNAMLRYQKKRLTIDMGLIDMQHFVLQEKFWGYRYIARSFSDRYRFGPKADLGFDIIYRFSDWITVDFTLSNGEGYTNLQRDNTFKGALGFILNPLENDRLLIRMYGDIMSKSTDQTTLAFFAGYRFCNWFRLGAEYNHIFNYNFENDQQLYGYSVYGTVDIPGKFEIFGRYDWLSSNVAGGDIKPWHLVSDGSSIIAGVQYKPVRFFNIALNYQDWYPRAANEPNMAYLFLNIEFKY